MKKVNITNSNIFNELLGFGVLLGESPEDVGGALGDVECFARVDWDGGSVYAGWDEVTFDFKSPDTSKLGDTTLVAYIDLHKLESSEYLPEEIEFEYIDMWGNKQDKIPFCIQVVVEEFED